MENDKKEEPETRSLAEGAQGKGPVLLTYLSQLPIVAMAHFQFVFYIFCIIWNESYLSKYLVTHLIWHANPNIQRLIFYRIWSEYQNFWMLDKQTP